MQMFLHRTSTFHQEPFVRAIISAWNLNLVETLTFRLQQQHTVFDRHSMLERTSCSFKGINALLVTHDSIMISQYIILPLKIFQTSWHARNSTFLNPIIAVTWGGGFKINTDRWRSLVCVQICILPFSVCRWDIQSICLNTFLEGCQNCIDRDGENWVTSAHIVQSAHILLIQFWEIALPQKKKRKKKLSLFCHSASQVTFRANKLSGWKKWTERKGAIGL